ncbi:MAG: CPBP family intramembrane glutamic endopeptidase [Limisphaerales bacterium]
MRATGIIFIYAASVLLAAALVAPWAFHLGQTASGEIAFLKSLGAQPFHRYLSRCLLFAALAGLWPLTRAFQLTNAPALGLARPAGSRRLLGLGLAAGFGSLLAAALLLVLAGVRSFNFNHPPQALLGLVVNATLSAVVVAVLEEFFFRGVIFGALRRSTSIPGAVLVSSLIYSALHFLARIEHAGPVEWDSGLALLPRMLRGIGALENVVPAGLTLALGGAALALAYHRTGTLWFSIGLHAGWVFWLKVFKTLTTTGTSAGGAFWGTDRLLDGWLALGVMAAVLATVARWPETPHTPAIPDESGSSEPRP